MDVQIETQNVELPRHSGPSLRGRVHKAMSHVGRHIVRLQLTLRDVNGQKGGRDKVCTVRATLAEGGEVVVVDRNHGVRAALFGALRRTRVVINRELKRRRRNQRRNRANSNYDELTARMIMESA